jgi:preprotein translocase subunit Sec63
VEAVVADGLHRHLAMGRLARIAAVAVRSRMENAGEIAARRATRSMALTSHYKTLGVSPAASTPEVTAAWKRLVWEHHPDQAVSGDFAAANAATAAINVAYTEIMRARQRRARQAERPPSSAVGTVLGVALAQLAIVLRRRLQSMPAAEAAQTR